MEAQDAGRPARQRPNTSLSYYVVSRWLLLGRLIAAEHIVGGLALGAAFLGASGSGGVTECRRCRASHASTEAGRNMLSAMAAISSASRHASASPANAPSGVDAQILVQRGRRS